MHVDLGVMDDFPRLAGLFVEIERTRIRHGLLRCVGQFFGVAVFPALFEGFDVPFWSNFVYSLPNEA